MIQDHICGIQPSAHSHFQDYIIHVCFMKQPHSHQEQDLEIGRMSFSLLHHLFRCFHDCLKRFQKGFVRNFLPVDPESFIDPHQMR